MAHRETSFIEEPVWNTATPTLVSLSLPFYALEGGHFRAGSDYLVDRSFHDSRLLMYSLTGAGQIVTDGHSFRLPAGRAAVIDCRSPHSYYSVTPEWEFLWLHYGGTSADAYLKLLYPDIPIPVQITDAIGFDSSFRRLINSFTEQDTLSQLERSRRIEELLVSVISSRLPEPETGPDPADSTVSDPRIRMAVAYLEEHYDTLRDLDSLCAYLHVSKYGFIRRFKRTMGIPPYNYLTNYRITRAKRMLVTTDMPVEEIASACGFADTANFIAKFRTHTGLTPLHYRNSFAAGI